MKTLVLIALLSCCALAAGNRFVCYFPNWTFYRPGDGNFKVANIDPQLCTDLVYAFAVLDGTTYKIQIFDQWVDVDNHAYNDFIGLKSKNPNLKTTIAIGGWNDSHDGTKKYSKMVASPENRATFITSVVDFLKIYKFDGVDLDWEYPMGPSDKAGFAELMKELRAAFGTQYLLTVAVAANQTIIDIGYDVQVLAEKADYINLMTYDMHGPWENQTDHHAPLYKRPGEVIDNNVDYIVNYWMQKGFPAEKINLGIPLYGQSWTLGYSVEPKPVTLGAGPGAAGPWTREAGTLGYYEICLNIRNGGWEAVEDPEHLNGPYAFSSSAPKVWVGYDDINMAAVKSQYVLENQLGGAMVWDISTDDFRNNCGDGANPLMTTISETVLDAGVRFVCYFPNWAYYRPDDGYYGVDNINASLCTDMVYSFATLDGKTNKMVVFDPNVDIDQQFYSKFVALKNQNPKLKTTIAIGGWTDSHDETAPNKYSYMVASPENRTIFITSVMEFLAMYKFDGLDLDWEYPTGTSDKAGFAELMKELRASFGERYLLSVAVAANKNVIDLGYDVEVMNQVTDYVNIMAYDMHGPWETETDNHAPLYERSWDTDATNNIDYIINYWITKGLAPSKINMGIPLYGKSWTLNYTYTSDPTLPAPGLGSGAAGPLTGLPGFLGYHEICNYVKTSNWNMVVDPDHLIGPYASSPTEPITWVGFDDPEMANVKSLYVLEKNLGGAMVWDISTDDFRNTCGGGNNPVMTSISRTLLTNTTSSTTVRTSTPDGVTSTVSSSTSTTTKITTPDGVTSTATSSTTSSASTTTIAITSTTANSITSTEETTSQTNGNTEKTTRASTTRKTTEARTTVPSTASTPFESVGTTTTKNNGGRIIPHWQILLLVFGITLKTLRF